MKKSLTAFFVLTAVMASPAMAEMPGKVLHDDANCMKCHTDNPYSTKKTPTYPKLVKAVQFCNDNLNAGWFEDEVEQVADYLNQTYYKHPKP
ncbi:hypothetical protein J3998_03450 [Thiomicrorhabdus sp. 6S2-11]|uniref:Cytochrome c n=1 Tax=Thiomicrorhabdus marina TaxID=2818442 RepID=A0ABS3Q2R3_9GAMM|nr:hypothetical protein [Thiomicrorhabdus marina]MBO1926622.1 hypothetical protein [Thiomicrorhabdus marina]